MPRADRLLALMDLLRAPGPHRAADLARALKVSERTIYRDIDTLKASGVPVEGNRGQGYCALAQSTLPPLNLTGAELDALNLGIAIVAESADPDLRRAALDLAAKIDAALPGESPPEGWQFALPPFADSARGFAHLPVLRAAIAARQKLAIRHRAPDGTAQDHRVRPLRLDRWGRLWTLTAWSETAGDFARFRVDLIEEARALPALFVDEPGKRLRDLDPAP